MLRHTPDLNRRSHLATFFSVAAAALCLCTPVPALADPPPNPAPIGAFTIRVPDKPLPKIQTLKITVSVVNETVDTTFRITPPTGTPGGFLDVFMDMTPGPPATQFGAFPAPPSPATAGDTFSVFPPDLSLPASDPRRKKFVILINLSSDFNVADFCADTQDAVETWIVGTPAGNLITGICVQSIDQPGCTSSLRTVPLVSGTPAQDQIATVLVNGTQVPESLQGCRPGNDVILVLDKSGSMASGVTTIDPTSKMTKLHESVVAFVNQWDTLRTSESSMSASPPIQDVNDRLGVVLFASTAQWFRGEVGLRDFDSARADILAHIAEEMPTTATSIGSGLTAADGAFTAAAFAGNKKVILLMSDGMENRFPTTSATSTQVFTTPMPGDAPVPLQNQIPPLGADGIPVRIYSLTVGSGAGIVDAAINNAIATATGGYYQNTETDAAVLPNFYLEVLQNFLRYSSVETFRLTSAKFEIGSSYQSTIPVTSTTQNITFTVTWNKRNGALKATVTPPGGAAPIVKTDQSGLLIVNQTLPIPPAQSGVGDWNIKIESVSGHQPVSVSAQVAEIPFNLIVMGDDSGMNADMSSIAADHRPGDKIRLRARVTELMKPLTGLNAQPGAKVLVQMVRPGASVGDLLSNSNINPGQTQPQDTQSAAALRLEAILANKPNALNPAEEPLTLLDNGNPANGDEAANDGVYSAVFPAQLVGHYNFVFALEGRTEKVGRFSRQHRRTVYVRAVPDANTTEFESSIQRGALVIQMTPKTKAGNRMGPGFANYFWFTAPGITPVKPVDNRNGTYTATINFSGAVPSPVSFHFVNDLVRLFDDVTPDKLPSPLNSGNTVVPNVPVSPGGFKRWGLSLHAGVSIPHGNFSNLFNPGPNVAVDLEYRFNQTFSLEGIYGYHRFNGETFGPFTVPDLNVHQLSLNGKVYGSSTPVRPFFNFGGGAYVFSPGATTRGGLNFGGGVQFDVTPNFAVEGVYNFHNVFTSGSNTRFSTVQGGVRFRF